MVMPWRRSSRAGQLGAGVGQGPDVGDELPVGQGHHLLDRANPLLKELGGMHAPADAARGARVIYIPPPLYYVAGLAGGMVIDNVVALPIGGRPGTAVAGAVVGAFGILLAGSGVAAMIRHAVTRLVIEPEERYLTERFGAAYADYRNRVRRWL
jgi:hypothetical protein